MAPGIYAQILWILLSFQSLSQVKAEIVTQDAFACLNTRLELTCGQNEILVFQSANFGRNSSSVARMCNTRYNFHCSYNVHSELNKRCAGKHRCLLDVNKSTMGDPCGEDEFLRVSYKCVNVNIFDHDCSGVINKGLVTEGYIASPNYPGKYFRGAHCQWSLTVQPTQQIRFTILDFELDVKRGTVCRDYVDVVSGMSGYYHECSRQGKTEVVVDKNKADITFVSDKLSSPERGFILFYEAIGPACNTITSMAHGQVQHDIVRGKYTANISCEEGYRVEGTTSSKTTIYCIGNSWNQPVPSCLPLIAPTIVVSTVSSTRQSGIAATKETKKPPILGLVMGLLGALVLIAILLSILFYCYRKQRRTKRHVEKHRIQNNLLEDPDDFGEGSLNMERQYSLPPYRSTPTPSEKSYSSYSKGKKKNKNIDKSPRKKLVDDMDNIDIRPYISHTDNTPFDPDTRYVEEEFEMTPRKKRVKKEPKNKMNKRNASCGNFPQDTQEYLPDEPVVPKRVDSRCSIHSRSSVRGSRTGVHVPPPTPTKVGDSPNIRRYSISRRRNSFTNSAPDLLSDDLYDSSEDCLSPPPGQVVVVGLPPVPPKQNFRRNNSIGLQKSATAAGRIVPTHGGYSTQI